jgi:hypothetical protein
LKNISLSSQPRAKKQFSTDESQIRRNYWQVAGRQRRQPEKIVMNDSDGVRRHFSVKISSNGCGK